jgi:arachidonate 15-lipoxygenase
VRVTFEVRNHRLCETSITSAELGTCRPGDPGWAFAKKLALCAVSNHMSLVRHWNWVHLTPAAAFAIATREHLGPDHPIARLLWPHLFGTIQSNHFGNMAQLTPEGDFEAVFSFTRRGLYDLLRDTHRDFSFDFTDPTLDAAKRHLNKDLFDGPTQNNLVELFNHFLRHTILYVGVYYPSGSLAAAQQAAGTPLKTKRELGALADWLTELNKLLPHGTGYDWATFTSQDLARLVARFIHLVSAVHESVGSALWNYQLWSHRQPVRLYTDGRREPQDVYLRLVHFNYMLNVNRTPLVADYSALALPGPNERQAQDVFKEFEQNLKECDRDMRKEPWAVWKLYPKDLEAHINA